VKKSDDRILAASLGVLTLLVYARSLNIGFYSDDFQWLGRMAPTQENPFYVFHVFYRDFNPVLHVSFLFDYIVGGGNAVAFHATSILIHAANAVLLFYLCRRWHGNPWVAVIAAVIWSFNVRVSEAVIWPAARGHSLATLLVLAALLALGLPSRRRDLIVPILFVLALLTKETAMFPLLLAPWFTREPRRAIRLWITLGGIVAGFILLNLLIKPELHLSGAGPSMLALKAPFILLRPLGLGDYYDFSYPMLVLVSGLLLTSFWILRRTTGFVGLLWIVVCAVPIIPLDKLSSRYLYMLSIGYALVMCGMFELAGRVRYGVDAKRVLRPLVATLALLVIVANGLFVQREINDYAELARPYARCLEALRDAVMSMTSGETFVVVDVSGADAVLRMQERMRLRGNMNKLIPYRQNGVGGLIELHDAVNILKSGEGGLLGRPVRAAPSEPSTLVIYDGRRAWRTDGDDSPEATSRRFAARLEPADAYFAAGL
jgi:hypothetical protein